MALSHQRLEGAFKSPLLMPWHQSGIYTHPGDLEFEIETPSAGPLLGSLGPAAVLCAHAPTAGSVPG